MYLLDSLIYNLISRTKDFRKKLQRYKTYFYCNLAWCTLYDVQFTVYTVQCIRIKSIVVDYMLN